MRLFIILTWGAGERRPDTVPLTTSPCDTVQELEDALRADQKWGPLVASLELSFTARGRRLSPLSVPLSEYALQSEDRIYCLAKAAAPVPSLPSQPRGTMAVARLMPGAPRSELEEDEDDDDRPRGFQRLVEMGFSEEDVGAIREQFYGRRRVDPTATRDELIAMEEEWIESEGPQQPQDSPALENRQSDSEDEEEAAFQMLSGMEMGNQYDLLSGLMGGYFLGLMTLPVMLLKEFSLKNRMGLLIGIGANMFHAMTTPSPTIP